jgi:hypothetical protein
MTEELLLKALVELEAIKRTSLRECGVSFVDEVFLSTLQEYFEAHNGNK